MAETGVWENGMKKHTVKKQPKCNECKQYHNNPIIRNYPNSDNEFLGWRTCGLGNTIKGYSVHGCNSEGEE